MDNKNQVIAEIIPMDGKAWSKTGDISMVSQPPEGIAINNATNFITAIRSFYKIGEVLVDLRIFPYES